MDSDIKLEEKALIEIVNENGKVLTSELIRPEVARFALEMEQVLKENDHKSGWDEMGVHQIYSRIKDEFEELQVAYIRSCVRPCLGGGQNDIAEAIRKEAIDVANFCMFLCHNYPKK